MGSLLLLSALYFLFLSISNIAWLRLSYTAPRIRRGRMVSVLVPARNEEKNIGRCLDSLLNQTYKNYEIVVLDDQSTDGTWRILSEYAERHHDLVRIVKGEPLEGTGWCGKSHAMQQLAGHARGEYFFFTDADTVHGTESIAWAVTSMEWHRADCISGYVQQEMDSLGEIFIVPATYIMSTLILPLWLIGALPAPGLSFAVGQLIMFRRSTFEAIGGYSRIASTISDDLAVARELKRAGFREVFLDIRRHVRCRMYDGYRSSFNGLTKNFYDLAKNRSVFFAVAVAVLVVLVMLPLALIPIQLLLGNPAVQLTTFTVLLFLAAWSLALYDRGLRWWIPLLYPILFGHLLYMAWWGVKRVAQGKGVVWKDRVLR